MTDFPFIGYWAIGLVFALWVSENAPRTVTYALLGIMLIGALMNRQKMTPTRPDQRGK